MSKPQRQDSLNAQLGDLMKLAVDEFEGRINPRSLVVVVTISQKLD